MGQCIVCCQWTRFDGCGGGGRRRFSPQLARRSWPGIVCAGSRCKVALNVPPITCVCGWSYLIRAVAYAGRCPKSLCWGHAEASSESWAAFSLSRVWKRAYSGSGAASCGCWPAVVLAGMGHNAKFAQQALRKPVCAGTATAVMVAFFVNREWATAGYENRRKPAPVASEFDWFPSPCSDGFRFGD